MTREGFYTPDQQDALKLEASVLTPESDEQHKKLEQETGRTFIEIFGHLLSDDQIDYLQSTSTIVVDSETESFLLEQFNVPMVIDVDKAEIGGKLYNGYGPKETQKDTFPEGQAIGGFSTASGLTVHRKLESELPYRVSQSDMDFETNRDRVKTDESLQFEEKMDAQTGVFGRAVSSTHFARNVAHEKNHSIQDPSIPLPLREAQSYWIQNRVARDMGVGAQSAPIGSEGFIEAFEQLYKEFGDDLHLLIWGNLGNTVTEQALLERVKSRMTSEFVNGMLPSNLEWKIQDTVDAILPFYLEDSYVLEELEVQAGVLNPHQKEAFDQLERKVSTSFMGRYGKFLNRRQRQYLAGSQVLFTSPELATGFKEWDKQIDLFDPDISCIDGIFYVGYEIGLGNPNQDQTQNQTPKENPPDYTAQQYWAGRIVVFPLPDDIPLDGINIKWLISQKAFDQWGDAQDISVQWNALGPHLYTNIVGGDILHEKVHGMQDPRLPLPILEAAAYFYERELFQEQDWYTGLTSNSDLINSNMRLFANLYQDCLAEIGEDLHRYIFGTLDDPLRWAQVHEYMTHAFSSEKIKEMSVFNEFSALPNSSEHHIQWVSIPKADVK